MPDFTANGRRDSFLGDARELPLNQSFAFLYRDNLITFKVRKVRDCAARPNNLDVVNVVALPKAKMQPRILGRLVTHPALSLLVLHKVTR